VTVSNLRNSFNLGNHQNVHLRGEDSSDEHPEDGRFLASNLEFNEYDVVVTDSSAPTPHGLLIFPQGWKLWLEVVVGSCGWVWMGWLSLYFACCSCCGCYVCCGCSVCCGCCMVLWLWLLWVLRLVIVGCCWLSWLSWLLSTFFDVVSAQWLQL